MKIQRTIPPAGTQLYLSHCLQAITGLLWSKRYLKKIEGELKDLFGVKHLFLVSSGKAALTLILLALKCFSSRRQVLIPAYTCFSVPSAIVKAGLEVALCDIDAATLDFNHEHLAQSIGPDTLCVVPTHLFGIPADMECVRRLCHDSGIFVVEDAAQAMGGTFKGSWLGTLGDVGFFSLARGKNITCGSGGIILTNSDPIADALRLEYSKLTIESPIGLIMNVMLAFGMRFFQNPWLYWLPASLPFLKLGETKFDPTFPMYRLDGLRAGLLLKWQKRLREANYQRNHNAQAIMQGVSPETVIIGSELQGNPAYLRLPVLLPSKEQKHKLCTYSRQRGLGISPMYPTAVHEIKALSEMLANSEYPVAKMVAEQLVTMPIHPLIGKKEINKLCQALNDFERQL